MNARNLKILAAVFAVLVVAFLILKQGGSGNSANALLFPDLKSQVNDVSVLRIRNGNETITVEKPGETWAVRERDGYPADVDILRELLLALADAKVIEHKTSRPDKYHLIGVNDPADEDSEAVEISINGDGVEYVVFLGKTAQTSYRYARVGGQSQSLLIDQDPDIPNDAAGWLAPDIVDISNYRVQRVSITHADGEEVVIEKTSEDAEGFDVLDIPDGRELNYAGVANGIADTLVELSLDDVRRAPAEETIPGTTTVIQTFDAMRIDIGIFEDGDSSWISVHASADDGAETDVQEEAARINERLSNWHYAIPDYKLDLLKRRFEELLKAPDTD